MIFCQDAGSEKAFTNWKAVYNQLEPAPGSAKTMVPHAPYTVSPALFEKINAANPASGATISIHNQETPPEDELFLYGAGAFYDFYDRFGISLEQVRRRGRRPFIMPCST